MITGFGSGRKGRVALQPSSALLPQFVLKYGSFTAIQERDFGAISNYNSLRVSLNRPFASGIFRAHGIGVD
jgi:hypothetical protein